MVKATFSGSCDIGRIIKVEKICFVTVELRRCLRFILVGLKSVFIRVEKKQTVKPTKHPRAECRIFEVNLKLQALMQKPILHKICLLLMKIIIGAINWNIVFQQL